MARGTGSTLDIPASFCHTGQGFQSWPGLPVTGLQETNKIPRLKADLNQEHLCWCHWFMDIYNPGTSVCQCLLLRVGRKCVACEAKTSTGGSRRNKDGPKLQVLAKATDLCLDDPVCHAACSYFLPIGLRADEVISAQKKALEQLES